MSTYVNACHRYLSHTHSHSLSVPLSMHCCDSCNFFLFLGISSVAVTCVFDEGAISGSARLTLESERSKHSQPKVETSTHGKGYSEGAGMRCRGSSLRTHSNRATAHQGWKIPSPVGPGRRFSKVLWNAASENSAQLPSCLVTVNHFPQCQWEMSGRMCGKAVSLQAEINWKVSG